MAVRREWNGESRKAGVEKKMKSISRNYNREKHWRNVQSSKCDELSLLNYAVFHLKFLAASTQPHKLRSDDEDVFLTF